MTSPPAVQTPQYSPVIPPPKGSSGEPPPDWLAEYPPPRSLPLDQEALRIYEHAYALGLRVERPGTPRITFSTVIAALLTGEDETSRWFARLAAAHGPRPEAVFAEKGVDESAVLSARPRPGRPHQVQLSSDKHLLTASARSVLTTAEGWAQRVGGTDIGVRHLVASYVLNPPPAHGAQMERWGYQETRWRAAFFSWVANRYTAEQWTDASHRPAPTKAIPAFEQQEVKGEALASFRDASTDTILERAAALHARRADRWLRLQTVFHALVETASEDAAVREAIEPIWTAVAAAAARYELAKEKAYSAPARPITSFSQVDISPRVLNALEAARELALATRTDADGELRVGVLHLSGALVSRRVDGDDELESMGLDPHALRLALIQFAHERGEPGEVWREALGEEETAAVGRSIELNSDEPEAVVRLDEDWTSDPLGIRQDVETFAALLASKKLEPPLSIGLFGPWGSGKTTFLRRLRRAVDQRAAAARDAAAKSRPTAYVGNVVHVDFNAWHFAEGALTSSLVDTILRALGEYIRDDRQIAGRAWRDQKLAVLESTRRKVEAAIALEATASAAVARAETELAESRTRAAKAATSLREALERAWSATKQALNDSPVVKESGVLEAIGDAAGSTEELRERLAALRARPGRLLSDLGWGRSLLFAALVLGVPPLVAWLTGRVLQTDRAVELLSTMTATLTMIGVWARAATGAVAKVDSAVARVSDEYAKRVDRDEGVKTSRGKLEVAQADAATAASSLQAARDELARARTEAANASLPAQMLQLVSGRIDAETYTKELTTLSLARADLEALSRILRDQRSDPAADAAATATAEGNAPAASRAVDRVILYIDDLDRCKPADVVRVLQIVHMLLAFELFVVVVAVDARWVEESLRQSYRWLGGSDGTEADGSSGNGEEWRLPPTGRVTPQDYLEKIFQIAFWLEPMTASRAASFLGSLVREPVREDGPVTGAGPADVRATDGAATAPVFSTVEIAGIELDYMRALAAYVGSSPRRVKRLVNAYRLIKARLSDAQLATFLTDRAAEDGTPRSGPYQLVIGLLVIGTGAPASSAQILRELAECDPGDGMDDLVERFRARNQPDWTMAARVIETLMRTQKTKNVSELRGWARKVGRFLLNRPATDVRASGQEPTTSAVPPALA